MDCLFCKIVAGDIPARVIYQDASAIAFLDISPWHVGHSLVIPRRHVADVLEDPEGLSEIIPAVNATSRLLVKRLGADGINLLNNTGSVAGQEVFHLHLHLVPRYGHRPGLPELLRRESGIDLDRVYRQITG